MQHAIDDRPGSAAGTPDTDGPQFLTFSLGDDIFAMDIRAVREIVQVGPMTPVPLMPEFVRGVINLRGSVVPVIDLPARFGRPRSRIDKRTCIVLFDTVRDGERVELGLLVDAVSEVIGIDAGSMEDPPAFGAPVRREFIRAIARVARRFVVVLDPDTAFDIAELTALCAAAPAPAALAA